MSRYCAKIVLLKPALAVSVSAVLAIYAGASADIQRREVAPQVSLSVPLVAGGEPRCAVASWSGVGLEGSCGSYRWEEIKPGGAFAMLKALVPSKDSGAARDALAVLLSLEDSGPVGNLAVEWAKRQGLAPAQIAEARAEAALLVKARSDAARAREAERALRTSPEAAVFAQSDWLPPTPAEFAEASAVAVEAARALLARAGGSATLHEADHVAVLAESGDPVFAQDAAALEAVFTEWTSRLAASGVTVAVQGRIPVVFAADRDRWRQLVVTAFGGDPDAHADSVTVYPTVGSTKQFAAAIVLVAPEGDRTRARHAALVGLARAVLHYSGAPSRAPAFLTEGLPRVMADVATPKAGVDAAMRRQALTAVRAGASFTPVVRAGYADPIWTNDPARARALSYIFVRWLWDNDSGKVLRLARSSGAWGAAGGDPLDARFAKAFGMSPDAACAKARQWFMTND